MATTVTSLLKTGDISAGGLKTSYMQNTLDFSATNTSATNIVQVFTIPAQTVIVAIGIDVTTGEGATCTVDLGDGDSTTRYLTSSDIETTGNRAAAAASVVPYVYTAADTIDMIMDHATDAAVVRVWAVIAKVQDTGG